MSDPIIGWMRRHDPDWYALRKAVKVAVVVTIGVAIGSYLGNGQLTLFASFGGVALLLFADFPGGRSARLGAYIGLVLVGAVLICLGTLASNTPWLAVVGMAVAGFVILFAGVLSAAAAGATRAALLTFILPVTVPGTATDMVFRLGGWFLAAAMAVPVAILVWPPADHQKLRRRGAEACAALAAQLTARVNGDTDAPGADTGAQQAIIALRRQFRSTTCRPVGLTSGSRVLMQLTDRLEWLHSVALRIPAGSRRHWPSHTVELVGSCAAVLTASGQVQAAADSRPSPQARQVLAGAIRELEQHRARVSVFLEVVADGARQGSPAGSDPAAVPAGADDTSLRPAVAHELAYTTLLAGSTVAVSAAADARPLLDRLLGRRLPGTLDGPVAAAHRIAAGHITRRSVWFQNSLRGALGLAFAVFLAEITQIQHGFWVVLGAMSVLRTTALTTGSTALRALVGTLAGFVVGAVIMLAVGTTPWHLWVLLPVSVLIAGYLPEAVSFIAGQAAFTVMVVVLFNIIEPVGWSVGLVRIEDVALGCLAGTVSGILLWPRGAAAQIRAALCDHYRRSADALEAAVDRLTGRAGGDSAVLGRTIADARSASLRLDDVLREYLFERGTKSVPVAELTALTNGAVRVRLAAEAVAGMTDPLPSVPLTFPSVTAAGPSDDPPAAGDERDGAIPAHSPAAGTLQNAGADIAVSATEAAGWYRGLADVLSRTADALPADTDATVEQQYLRALRRDAAALGRPAVAARARTLWAAALFVDDVARLEERLRADVETINAPPTPGTVPAEIAEPAPADRRSPVGSTP
ncbi:FUSC family protein [Nakamurella sp. GG22]